MRLELLLSWVPVRDLELAKQFYGETLGLAKWFETPGWAEYRHAPYAAGIGLSLGDEKSKGIGATIVLGVDDLEHALRKLEPVGVAVEGPVDAVPGVARIATFRDPFGNRLQLVESMLRQ